MAAARANCACDEVSPEVAFLSFWWVELVLCARLRSRVRFITLWIGNLPSLPTVATSVFAVGELLLVFLNIQGCFQGKNWRFFWTDDMGWFTFTFGKLFYCYMIALSLPRWQLLLENTILVIRFCQSGSKFQKPFRFQKLETFGLFLILLGKPM